MQAREALYVTMAADLISCLSAPLRLAATRVRARNTWTPLVVLAQRGVEAEAAARKNLDATCRRFMAEDDPECKDEAGRDLIRAIFGKDAIAEDPIF